MVDCCEPFNKHHLIPAHIRSAHLSQSNARASHLDRLVEPFLTKDQTLQNSVGTPHEASQPLEKHPTYTLPLTAVHSAPHHRKITVQSQPTKIIQPRVNGEDGFTSSSSSGPHSPRTSPSTAITDPPGNTKTFAKKRLVPPRRRQTPTMPQDEFGDVVQRPKHRLPESAKAFSEVPWLSNSFSGELPPVAIQITPHLIGSKLGGPPSLRKPNPNLPDSPPSKSNEGGGGDDVRLMVPPTIGYDILLEKFPLNLALKESTSANVMRTASPAKKPVVDKGKAPERPPASLQPTPLDPKEPSTSTRDIMVTAMKRKSIVSSQVARKTTGGRFSSQLRYEVQIHNAKRRILSPNDGDDDEE
ncbi:hypothetical protein FRB99_001105 [Tulasnella sp. 403]|nr:hypothetical protein FRB99_001105 [Tulasnella sp. 403]